LVSANSTAELAGLEALVRLADGMELAGSGLGRASLAGRLTETHPDVLLESLGQTALAAAASSAILDGFGIDFEGVLPATVWLVPRSGFGAALLAVRESEVQGVLPVWASAREIAAAIEAVAHGLVTLHPEIARSVGVRESSPESSATAPGQSLSPREAEILNLLASGLGNKEVAWRLRLSEHTVKFHVTSIFNKLGVSSRAEAVASGMRRGLISL
jgi:two-component system, NarL family, response regulator YdfI